MLGFRASSHSEIPAFNLDTLLFHRSLGRLSLTLIKLSMKLKVISREVALLYLP